VFINHLILKKIKRSFYPARAPAFTFESLKKSADYADFHRLKGTREQKSALIRVIRGQIFNALALGIV
jgi:hypothetical protein